MIVMIEGVDAAGKSTLAGILADKYEAEIVHHTYKKGWSPYDLLSHHLDWLKIYDSEKNYIFDRSWPSCSIYARVFRNVVDEIPVDVLDFMLRNMGAYYIMCIPEHRKWADLYVETCKSKEGQMYGTDSKMHDIYDGYRELTFGGTSYPGGHEGMIVRNGGLMMNYQKTFAYDIFNQKAQDVLDFISYNEIKEIE